MNQHRWVLDPIAGKKEEPTEYDKNPDLDDDIITTQGHEKLAQKFLVKETVAKEDKKKTEEKKEETKKEEKKAEEKKEDEKKAEEKKDDDKKEEEEEEKKEDDKQEDEKKEQEEKKEEEKKDDAKVQLDSESDPICHSAGCSQYLFPKPDAKKLYPMDYFVPQFGVDPDVISTFNSLDVAQEQRDHIWHYVPETKPKPEPTQYNDNMDLDADI